LAAGEANPNVSTCYSAADKNKEIKLFILTVKKQAQQTNHHLYWAGKYLDKWTISIALNEQKLYGFVNNFTLLSKIISLSLLLRNRTHIFYVQRVPETKECC